MKGVQSELLKYRRTFIKKLAVLLPLLFVLQAVPSIWLMPKDVVRGWEHVDTMVFNIWTTAFLPLGIALFTYLADLQERKSGGYRSLRAHAYFPANIWVSKVIVIALMTLIAAAILFAATILSGLITVTDGKWAIPWATILLASLFAWVTSLAIIPIQLWVATRQGLFASMGLGFFGFIAGVFIADKAYWFVFPWSWAPRMMCPLLQLNPNGVMLEAGDPLLDTSVLPLGLVLSIAAFVIFTGITALWFQRRELK
ncbi:lantibiotic immunity ABC transporter MutE/EpiE family permease subunit [Streptococcus pantholopis]|uniref:Multidrug ABC transporter permease n=1 Tax=Streptococcus pantholopis TaxID=1811193 RepID=A0A172Q9J4_9STRE|nr:lantibiotic immunity ABC transporter MutE/EpiE family permease subunit [Streptococcus pantholopis]AND80120.1 multidrug ABC transporter permease [Streptococcus pantholopis]